MGNFEKLSVLVIVVIIVMILVVALHTWGETPADEESGGKPALENISTAGGVGERDEWATPVDNGLQPLSDTLPPLDEADGPARDPLDVEVLDADDDETTDADMPEPPAAGPREYIIKSGDTLGEIAERECGSVRMLDEITTMNPGVDPSALRVGQKLLLPAKRGAASSSSTRDAPASTATAGTPGATGAARPGGSYTTRAGDTFERISKRVYGTIERWPDIWVANLEAVPDSDRIPAGTVLKLPN